MQQNQKLENALRLEIKRRLEKCDDANTPKIKQLLEEKGGYLKVEEMIILKAIHDQVSIGACIALLESELL